MYYLVKVVRVGHLSGELAKSLFIGKIIYSLVSLITLWINNVYHIIDQIEENTETSDTSKRLMNQVVESTNNLSKIQKFRGSISLFDELDRDKLR